MVRSQLKPKLIFYQAIDLLIREKIAAPGYHGLSLLTSGRSEARKKQLIEDRREASEQGGTRKLDSLPGEALRR